MSTTGPSHSLRRRPQTGATDLPTLLTIGDVAEHLSVSVRHVRRLVFERRIPYVKWGHLLRFDVADINAWLAESRVPAADDPSSGRRR